MHQGGVHRAPSGPSSLAASPASASRGPGSGPAHLHLQQLLLHQPLQCLLLLWLQVVAARVSQVPPPHDGMRERAAGTGCQDGVPSHPRPFQPHLPTPWAPEVRAALEEATGELLHLLLPRHFAQPGIGGSRLFFFSASVSAFDSGSRTRSATAPWGEGPLALGRGPRGSITLPDETCFPWAVGGSRGSYPFLERIILKFLVRNRFGASNLWVKRNQPATLPSFVVTGTS